MAGAPAVPTQCHPTVDRVAGGIAASVKARTKRPANGKIKVRVIEYDMGEFMQTCVDTYCELAKCSKNKLPKAWTPFVEETGKDFFLGAESERWCNWTPEKMEAQMQHALVALRAVVFEEEESNPVAVPGKKKPPAPLSPYLEDGTVRGKLQSIAA